MAVTPAQADMCRAHVNGGAGVLVSGLVWLLTGVVLALAGERTAFFVLFVAGMAIAPLAQLATRFVFRAPAATTGKRLERIALVTVPILLAGFYLGWRGLADAPERAIPIVAIAVGVRYLVFPVMFGSRAFLALGAVFIALGWLGMVEAGALPVNIALVLGLVELAVGAWLWQQWRRAPAVPG